MRAGMRRLLAILLLLVAAPAAADDGRIAYGDYYALVIGNNDYAFLPKLETAVSDAAAVAELLRSRYAFKDVKLLLNARRADILREMNRLRAELTGKDNLLIYYAGHGYVDLAAEEGFWQPVDARDEDDTQWISNSTLTRYLKTMTAKHVMVVADSCYSGTLLREAGSGPPVGAERIAFLQRMATKRARVALASGGLEPVADSGANGHSVFANALLTALRDNREVMDGQTLFQRIKRPVVLNARQTPQYADVRNADHEGGDFLFVPAEARPKASPAPATASAADAAAAIELAFWNSVKDSRNRAALEAYLARYPDGVFAPLAQIKLDELTDGDRGETQTALVAPPPKPASPELVPVEAVYVALKNANVRSGAAVSSTRVATLQAGSEVYVAGRTAAGDWLAVERDGKRLGYVYAPLLQDKAAYEKAREAARKAVRREAAKPSPDPAAPPAPRQAAVSPTAPVAEPSPAAPPPLAGEYRMRLRTIRIRGKSCLSNRSVDAEETVYLDDKGFTTTVYASGMRIDIKATIAAGDVLRFSGTVPSDYQQSLRDITGSATRADTGFTGEIEIVEGNWCGPMDIAVELIPR